MIFIRQYFLVLLGLFPVLGFGEGGVHFDFDKIEKQLTGAFVHNGNREVIIYLTDTQYKLAESLLVEAELGVELSNIGVYEDAAAQLSEAFHRAVERDLSEYLPNQDDPFLLNNARTARFVSRTVKNTRYPAKTKFRIVRGTPAQDEEHQPPQKIPSIKQQRGIEPKFEFEKELWNEEESNLRIYKNAGEEILRILAEDKYQSENKKSFHRATVSDSKPQGPLTVDELMSAIHYATEQIEKSIPEDATAENGENYLLEYAGRIIEAYTESDLRDLPELRPCITLAVQPFLLIPSAECCTVGVNNVFFVDGTDSPKSPHASDNSKTNIVNLLDDK